MLTFIANDESGLPQKRKHIQRACDECRRRKKRCEHLNDTQSSGRLHKDNVSHGPGQISSPLANSADDVTLPTATVSHLPQSVFSSNSLLSTASQSLTSSITTGLLAADKPRECETPTQLPGQASGVAPEGVLRWVPEVNQDGESSSFVGNLNPEATFLAATSPQTTGSQGQEGVGVWSTREVIDNIRASLSGLNHPQAASSLFEADPIVSKLLLPYLCEQCTKILPSQHDYLALETIFYEEVQPLLPVLDAPAFDLLPDNSHSKLLMKQAICLAASTNARAASHLNLVPGQSLNHKEFSGKLSRAIRLSLDIGIVQDKIVLIQVLALLSLFTQLSEDKHLSADLNGRLISLIQTLGLHLQTQENRKDHTYVTRLFCCAWALDRLNAAFHGRPVLMHERDFGHDMKNCIAEQEPAFQLMLRIVDLLDRVISLYRPTNEINGDFPDEEFPAFEKLLDESGAHRIKSHLTATIETFYHSVAMLSCRSQSVDREGLKASMNTAANLRQTLSASRVTFIVGKEFRGQLSLLPFVPYSVSLALRVSYRELRTSKAPLFRARARRQMLEQCKLLRQLGDIFWSALVMVELSEQTIREMDKVTFNIVNHQQKEQSSKQHPQHVQVDEQHKQAAAYPEVSTNGDAHYEDAGATNWWQISGVEMTPLPSTYDPDNFDLSLIDYMAEFDVFQHFDPRIDLDNIDAALGDFSQSYDFIGLPG